ncbi:MAG: carboxypeptidase regulatory-like domain-containing protein, partial [Deltaproteobacteria bacterium]|nr:carboxypeptidase regulatory-like domain-containing protein [Deltaproteobacteria bacterium]
MIIPIYGAKFRPRLTAWLIGSDLVQYEATSVIFENSTIVHAIFDLRPLTPGLYDVHVELQGLGRTLVKAFEVVSGTPGQLETRVLMPEKVRVGREFIAWIDYVNTGGTNLLAPIVSVESPSGAKLKLRPYDGFVDSHVAFQAIAMMGPPGILGPGQSGRIPVYVLPLAGENRVITRFAYDTNTETMNWDAVKAAVRPPSAPPEWDAMWDTEIRSYGNKIGDYVRLLSEAATLRWVRKGERSPYIDENLRFLISEKMTAQRSQLSGYVYLDDLIHPMGGVWISATSEEGETGYAVSEHDGLIRLEGLAAGTYTLRFIDHILVDGPETITIPGTGEISGQVWVVRRGATIYGRVQAPSGTDFTDTSALALHEDGSLFTGRLDGAGRYSIRGLPAGAYRLSYSQPSLYCQDVDVIVENGDTVYVNDILCYGGGSVSGLVTEQLSGNPLAGIVVTVSGEEHLASALSGGDGTYLLTGLKPGFWTIVAHGEGYRSDPQENVQVIAGQT